METLVEGENFFWILIGKIWNSLRKKIQVIYQEIQSFLFQQFSSHKKSIQIFAIHFFFFELFFLLLSKISFDFLFDCGDFFPSSLLSASPPLSSSLSISIFVDKLKPSMYGFTNSNTSLSCWIFVESKLNRTMTGSNEWKIIFPHCWDWFCGERGNF